MPQCLATSIALTSAPRIANHCLMKSAFAFVVVLVALVGCRGRVVVEEPREECRTVLVRNPHEREECHTRCGDEGCRTKCREHERVAREKRCWVD